MKEIDFLPEWYKSGRRRKVSYRTQYVALSGVLLVMIVWNFVAGRSVSQAKAQLAQMVRRQANMTNGSRRLAELKREIEKLNNKADSIKAIDSKIDVAAVLGELSFLIDERIVLARVELIAEKFKEKKESNPATPGPALVRIARPKVGVHDTMYVGDVRFRVVITGVAAEGRDVAELICKLEDSPYFCQVVLSFSQDSTIRDTGASAAKRPDMGARALEQARGIRASEFEIGCYLANYTEE
jgi:cell division protein FtsB